MLSDSSVKIEISEAEMLRIFSAFNENKFLSFPNYFECDDKQSSYITPSGEITIEFTFNGIVKKVINSYFCSVKKDKTKEDCFEKISSLIFEIIHNKPEVQKMKESDWIFE